MRVIRSVHTFGDLRHDWWRNECPPDEPVTSLVTIPLEPGQNIFTRRRRIIYQVTVPVPSDHFDLIPRAVDSRKTHTHSFNKGIPLNATSANSR